jgi:hypothetical protein
LKQDAGPKQMAPRHSPGARNVHCGTICAGERQYFDSCDAP